MSYIEFVYYDTVYNESVFIHTYDGPFVDKMEFELLNTQVMWTGVYFESYLLIFIFTSGSV